MNTFDVGNQLGVALLAVLGALLARRLPVPRRLHAVLPLILATLIFQVFAGLEDFGSVVANGAASGLLASGLLYVIGGLMSR